MEGVEGNDRYLETIQCDGLSDIVNYIFISVYNFSFYFSSFICAAWKTNLFVVVLFVASFNSLPIKLLQPFFIGLWIYFNMFLLTMSQQWLFSFYYFLRYSSYGKHFPVIIQDFITKFPSKFRSLECVLANLAKS